MELERKFDWNDTETSYKPVNEEKCEDIGGGKVRFTTVSVDGRKFAGIAFQSTVAQMVDTKPYWKLEAATSKTGKTFSQVTSAHPGLQGKLKAKV